MLEQFTVQFTKERIEYVKQGNHFFFIPHRVKEFTVFPNPISRGLFLGEVKTERFYPSLPLLSWIAPRTMRKIVVTDKAAWLFLCGRDIQNESILRKTIKTGLVLVQNKKDENIGYGFVTPQGIENLLDRGDYLRRERKSSRTR